MSSNTARLSLETRLNPPIYEHLMALSSSGELTQWIPEWDRLTGERNIQHQTHYYPLDEHTMWVVDKTCKSPHYLALNPQQQFFVALSAILHDIDKITGPERLRNKIPVDKLHPIKSAEMTRRILHRLGCTEEFAQRMYSIIHHHQAFGRLFIMYGHEAAQDNFDAIALKIRSSSVLECLLALSEGDIRAVRFEDEYFTPQVAESLPRYGGYVRDRINAFRLRQPIFPQFLAGDETHRLDLQASSSFLLPVDSATDLTQKLADLPWGGAAFYPYYPDLSAYKGRTGAILLRFLPDNLAFWGPMGEPVPPIPLPMNVFYNLFLGNRDHLPLTEPEGWLYDQLLSQQQTVAKSRPLDPEAWLAAFDAYEAQTYGTTQGVLGPFDLPRQCLDQLLQMGPASHWVGLGTRPMVTGILWFGEQKPVLESPWEHLPFYQG